MLPVEVEVAGSPGLFLSRELLDFGMLKTGGGRVGATAFGTDGFHSIFHHRNWRAKVSCDVDINQTAGSMVM